MSEGFTSAAILWIANVHREPLVRAICSLRPSAAIFYQIMIIASLQKVFHSIKLKIDRKEKRDLYYG